MVPALAFLAGSARVGSASWEDFKRILQYYVALLVVCVTSGIVNSHVHHPRTQIYFWAAWIVISVGFAFREWSGISRAFKLRIPKLKTTIELFGACAAALVFLLIYFKLYELVGFPMIKIVDGFADAHWPTWSIYVLISITPGIIEECTYRGIIQTKLSEIVSVREAWIIQAALFSIMHLSPLIFISHFVMGLLLGWVRIRVGHVYFGMVLHAAWNAAVVYQQLGHHF